MPFISSLAAFKNRYMFLGGSALEEGLKRGSTKQFQETNCLCNSTTLNKKSISMFCRLGEDGKKYETEKQKKNKKTYRNTSRARLIYV